MPGTTINTCSNRKAFTQPITDDDKDECKKFMAKYCAVEGLSPEECANLKWHPRMIHADLYLHYRKFCGYPVDKMQTSVPLIQSMYMYMNRVKKNVAEFAERIQDWIDIKEHSKDKFTENIKDLNLSEKSDLNLPDEHVSNLAQDSSVQIINEEPAPENAQEEVKDDAKLQISSEPNPAGVAMSGEMPQLGMQRPRPAADLTEYGADIALLFEARDTMKRAKKEHDEARQVIRICFETIKDVFDMPDLIGSKPTSPKV